MLRQRVENPRPGGLWGVALVLSVAAAVALSSRLFGWLSRWLGVWASAGFIASGCALAWFLMYWYVLSYGYSLDGSRLEVVRRYGRYERMATQVWLSRVQAVGEPEEIKRRFPGASVERATRRGCALEPLAIAYLNGEKQAILVIQPEDELRARLVAAKKKK